MGHKWEHWYTAPGTEWEEDMCSVDSGCDVEHPSDSNHPNGLPVYRCATCFVQTGYEWYDKCPNPDHEFWVYLITCEDLRRKEAAANKRHRAPSRPARNAS